MTSEIQVGRNRIHVSYLRKVVSRIARAAGMTGRDAQRIEEAVAQACLKSFAVCEDEARPITVRLNSCDSCVVAEVSDPSPASMSYWSSEFDRQGSGALDQIRALADKVELLREGDCCTLRMIKHSHPARKPASESPVYLAGGPIHLQS